MARIRTIKPEFFRHEELYAAEKETGLPLRVAYAGLWTAADREGRFKWSPKQLKLDCLPYDDVDFSRVLDALTTRGFVVRYASEGREYGAIPSWKAHQVINNREQASVIPEHNENNDLTRAPRVRLACPTPLVQVQGEGKGREGEDAAPTARTPADAEKELFERGKEVLGKGAGGLVARLRKSKSGSIELTRAAIEQAATKQNPREYIGRILSGPAPPGKVLSPFGTEYPDGII